MEMIFASALAQGALRDIPGLLSFGRSWVDAECH